ncbi:MAG: SUMF1/EgtB/PvdO family nonheme iron enzyme [Kiritimatiellae bacterium]|nr:SUMF1/EgtB/PvdO family nonheme iron enzyme [Kiritimatiellia bacterium]
MNTKTNVIKSFAVAAAALTSAACVAGEITVSDVAYAQTANRHVVITYRLTGSESAVVTIDVLTNGVSIGEQNFTRLSGDVNTIVAPSATETKHIFWKATKDWPNHKIDSGVTVKVCARALTNPPDYFVLDLTTGDRKYYNSTNALPDGGLANDIYKLTKLVMRRIPAGGETFMMGWPNEPALSYSAYASKTTPQHSVSFTNDFYMAIYETTAKQYATVWPSQSNLIPGVEHPQTEKQPRAYVPTSNIRGVNKYWPRDGHEVQDAPDRFIKLIRGIGGGVEFDLPTEAQWEFACSAGSTTLWYDNISWNGTQGVFVDGRGVCSQYMWADDKSETASVHEVGLLKPNAYGLYDMHGNVAEACLDAWASGTDSYYSNAAVEPTGLPASDGGTYRVVKGGGYGTDKALCGTCMRTTTPKAASYDPDIGFRLVCPAVAR